MWRGVEYSIVTIYDKIDVYAIVVYSMSTFVIIVETRPDHNFVVFHIEYTKELLHNHPEYIFFQDMLKSNMRMKTTLFLQTMLERGWVLMAQSQNSASIFHTLSKEYKKDASI